MRLRSAGVVLVASLALGACTAGAGNPRAVTVVLFDVSNSTLSEDVRARYEATFEMVLEHVVASGGVLGADVIDDEPLVHGTLPINETFEPCTINDNGLACRSALEERRARAREAVSAILATSSRGTDIFGALELAEQFFAAHPDAGDRTLVLLSDMIQSARGMHLGAVETWSEAETGALLARAPAVDLAGVRVYVAGAGATTLEKITAEQVEGIRAFWARWFQEQGARIVFYGANLPRFPVPETPATQATQAPTAPG
jgi:hypothetical protein